MSRRRPRGNAVGRALKALGLAGVVGGVLVVAGYCGMQAYFRWLTAEDTGADAPLS
jgi:hypothetical protein